MYLNLTRSYSWPNVWQNNVLIDFDQTLKLADFGLTGVSQTQMFGQDSDYSVKGSYRWMAPELFGEEAKKSRSTDIYAFAMTMIEVWSPSSSMLPYWRWTVLEDLYWITSFQESGGPNEMVIIFLMSQGKRPKRPEPTSANWELPDALWGLIQICWDTDPDKRYTADEIVRNVRVEPEIIPSMLLCLICFSYIG